MKVKKTAFLDPAVWLAFAISTCITMVAANATSVSLTPPMTGLVKVVLRDSADKGSLRAGDRASRHVVLLNVSEHALRIAVRTKTCGCISPQIVPEVIKPGESCAVSFEVPAVPSSASQQQSVTFRATTVETDPPQSQDIVIGVSFQVEFEYVVRPERWRVSVVQGEPFEADVFVQTLEQSGVTAISGQAPWPNVTVKRAEELVENGNRVVVMKISGVVDEPGSYSGDIRIKIDGASEPECIVRGIVEVLPRWRAMPAGVVANLERQKIPSTTRVMLRDQVAGGNARIAKAQVVPELPGVSCLIKEGEGVGSAVLEIEVNPAYAKGPNTGEVQLRDDKERVVGIVPIVLYKIVRSGPVNKDQK